jgi:hypothetical protein
MMVTRPSQGDIYRSWRARFEDLIMARYILLFTAAAVLAVVGYLRLPRLSSKSYMASPFPYQQAEVPVFSPAFRVACGGQIPRPEELERECRTLSSFSF